MFQNLSGWRRTAKSFFRNSTGLPPYTSPAFSLVSLLQWPLAESAANVAEGPLSVAGAMCAVCQGHARVGGES